MSTPISPSTSPAAPPPPALAWRLLQPADLDTMEVLHRLSLAGMAAHTVKAESRDFLASLLQGRGQVIGAWAGQALVAYGVLQHDLLPEDDPRPHLGLSADRPAAKLAGAAVAPDWRGQHLQRTLIAKRMAQAQPGAVLFATAAPDNTASWHNLLACGFVVRGLQLCYGGFPRYLLAHDPSTPAPLATNTATGADSFVDVDSLDLARQHALLHAGWQGVAPGSAAGSLRWVPAPGAAAGAPP